MQKQRMVRVKASELVDVDVDLISLVKRPSSRIPWGIIKSEDAKGGSTMKGFDLGQLFVSKAEAPAPVVTSVLVKGEPTEQMLELLGNQGFSVENAETTEDGVTVFKQDVEYTGDVNVVKLSETLALTVPVVKADGSFAEMAAARGFYPSISIATELLQCELYRVVEKSDSPAAAAGKVADLVNDFGSFMSSLVGGLPAVVFKTEQAVGAIEVEKAEKRAAPKAVADPADAGAGTVPTGDAVPAPTAETTPAVEAAPVETGDHNSDAPAHEAPTNPIADATAAAEAPAEEAPAVEAATRENEPVAEAVDGKTVITHVAKDEPKGLTAEDVAAIVASTVEKSVEKLVERIDGIEQGVQKAEEKLGTTVFGGVFGESRNRQPEDVEKAEERLPLLDTGFMRRNDA